MNDVTFFTGLSEWLEGTEVSTVTYGHVFSFTKIAYPDGKTFFRYNGTNLFGNPNPETVTEADLINIYRTTMSYNSPKQWSFSPLDAFLDTVGPGIVVAPAEDRPSIHSIQKG